MSNEMIEPRTNRIFTEDETTLIENISSNADLEDPQYILEFGVQAQTEIADFADVILDEIKSKDSGYVGDILTSLMANLGEVDAQSLTKEKQGIFSNLKRKARRFMAKFEKLSSQIDEIVLNLETVQHGLMRDVTLLDNMYDKNHTYINNLDIYIQAGKNCIQEIKTEILPTLNETAQSANDPLATQKARDMQANLDRFDKKVGDLQLSRMVAIQSLPQIRLVQQNDEVLIERIQSSILNTIPLWKNQIVIAITIIRQNAALKLQRDVTDTTNELLKKNSEMLKEGSIETAIEAERGIVEIETLQQVNNDLIETISEVIRIQAQGSQARADAEIELANMENQLKQHLLNARK